MRKIFMRIAEKLHYIVFALFAVMQALIIDKIVLFGDDYYYTTFFYNGVEYFVSENIKHWLETNGRAFVHLLDELLLADGSIIMWKIFATVVICLIALFSALIASRAWDRGAGTAEFRRSLIISCVCISFVSIFTANQTLYWATGFLNYVYPILLTLMLFYYTEKALARERFSLWICLLSFLACSSTEQNSFVSICILVFALVRIFTKRKKPSLTIWLAFAFGALGLVLLFFAPGNSVRTTYYADFYATPLWERITQNVVRLINLIFKKSGADRALVLFFGAAACFFFSKYSSKKRMFAGAINAGAVIFLLLNIHFAVLSEAAVIMSFLAFAVCVFASLLDFVKNGNTEHVFFTCMAAVAQGAMLISPEMGPRTLIVSIVFLIIPTAIYVSRTENVLISLLAGAVLLSFMTVIGKALIIALIPILIALILCLFVKEFRDFAIPAAILIIALLMIDSLFGTLTGYSENYVIHKENEALISEYKETLEDGGEHTLTQKYLPNGVYKYTMPYDDPYHMYWFKVAKKIPTDTDIRYE
ncbi:MAG: hypothetical protein E7671_00990 [Ruminococcaceae bacterium]|nr:hypothetical protein [Oscillospiraceae bacterium]